MIHAPHSPTWLNTEMDGLSGVAVQLDTLQPGQQLGAYKLVRVLGTGGMGQVWLAEQQQPLQRMVALKLQKDPLHPDPGADVWFQIERQALARLQHPYIAQIYDAGSLADGALYFAMEYVDGLRLDEWLERRQPSLEQLVDVLIRLCQGVQHAHQRGLLHRDLKPANVLITEVAGQPMPKIIDFGVAIGLDPRSGLALGPRRAGTRAWMAPEQLNPPADGIDARVDVYALGLLLALSMCGVLGLDQPEAGSQHLENLFGRSTELRQRPEPAGEGARATVMMDLAARRRIPQELRCIAGRAIAPDRSARYDSPAALSEDLQRWRDGLPVRAVMGGRWYAWRCFMRRNALAVGAAAAVFAALITGIVLALLGLQEAREQRALAETRRERAEQMIGFMLGDFSEKLRLLGRLDLLDSVSAEVMRYLGDPTETTATDSTNSALYRARSLRTVGEVHAARGDVEAARSAFEDAWKRLAGVPAEPLSSHELQYERGQIAYWLGQLHYQARAWEAAQQQWQEYDRVADELIRLDAPKAVGLMEKAHAQINLGSVAFALGDFRDAGGRFDTALHYNRQYLNLYPDDTAAGASLSNAYSWLGRVYEREGNLRGALVRYREQLHVIGQVRQASPESHSIRYNQALAHFWVALASQRVGEVDEGNEHLAQAKALLESLVALDPTQSRWHRLLLRIRLYQVLAAANTGPAVLVEAAALRSQMAQGVEGDSAAVRRDIARLLRLDIRTRPAEAMAEINALLAESSELDQQILAYAELDRCIIAGVASCELERAQAWIESLGVDDNAVEQLDLRLRLALIQDQRVMAEGLQARLHGMGYRHPDLQRFIHQLRSTSHE